MILFAFYRFVFLRLHVFCERAIASRWPYGHIDATVSTVSILFWPASFYAYR
jgi:hypothetical protein